MLASLRVKLLFVVLLFTALSALGVAQSVDTATAFATFRQAQNNYYYGEFDLALRQAYVAQKLIHKISPPLAGKQVQANMLLARCLVFAEKPDSSIVYLEQAERLLYGQDQLDTMLLATVYGLLSHAYDLSSQLKLALNYSKKSIQWAKSMIPKHPKLGDYYHGLANVYYSLGDHKSSFNNYQRALDIYALTMPDNHPSVLETKMAISYSLILLKDYDRALTDIEALIQLASKDKENQTTLMALYSIKAVGLSKINRPEEALIYLDKSLELIYSLFGKENIYATDILQSKAGLFLELGQYDKAEKLYHQASDYCESAPGQFTELQAAIYTDYGRLLCETDKYEQGVEQFNKALSLLNFREASSLYEVAYFKELFTTVKKRGQAHLAHVEKTDNMVDFPLKDFDEAVDLISHARSVYIHEGSKEQLIASNYSIYEQALQSKFIAYSHTTEEKLLQEAFNIFEISKVQSMLDQLRQAQTASKNRLPENVYETKVQLEQKTTRSRQKLFNAKLETDSAYQLANNEYLQLRDEYEAFITNLKINYPEYYQFVYNQDVVSIATVRKSIINKRTALVEYFLGEKYLFVMYIMHDQLKFSKITITDELLASLAASTNRIDSLDKQIKTSSQDIRKVLGDNLYKHISPSIKKLIIIPDGELSNFPFETCPGKKKEYLIEEYEISYASSATLLAYQQQMKPAAEELFAGFAPTYHSDIIISIDTVDDTAIANLVRSGNVNLPSAVKEVETIAGLLNGDIFIDDQANESLFKERANSYRILHLAMHSIVNASNPSMSRLLFDLSGTDGNDDGLLHVEELYGMQLNASLAVLSACNTGYGDIKKGEGSLSIARAFAFCGVPTTLMSLWEVPDKSTSYIMVDFYKELKKGKPKDVALRRAKLNYLGDSKILPSLKTPFYWAGFIATGDMSPMKLESFSHYYFIGLGLVVLLLMTWLWIRRQVPKNTD